MSVSSPAIAAREDGTDNFDWKMNRHCIDIWLESEYDQLNIFVPLNFWPRLTLCVECH